MHIRFLTAGLFVCFSVHAQYTPAIGEPEATRIEKILSADDMQGRQVFKPGIELASSFIQNEFGKAGLKPLPGSKDFKQTFIMVDPSFIEATATLDGIPVDRKNIVALTADSSLVISTSDNYKKLYVKNQNDFNKIVLANLQSDENLLIFVDTSVGKRFSRLSNFHIPQFEGGGNRIFILTATDPHEYHIKVKQKTTRKILTNLVGILPGKSKPDEYVIFSAHYDHLGVGKPDAHEDSIYNGANDDASGTTAVIALAGYFSKLNNNQRTLVFAAFTAEEIGEFGSAYFSRKLAPDKIVAMLNIEMIGTESKWGKNSAYVTGFDKSDLGEILQKNLKNSGFTFYPDPYPQQMLFLRSDNATLARRGVPAHTISTSKMDSEKYYHTPGDAIETLDLKNMTEIIRAIGMSAGSIISGEDSPRRVIPE
jgi:hypothetical protein